MKVLLSIRPQFTNKILDGTKGYEFRKKIFQRTDVDKVIIYATSPISKIVGEFTFNEILYEDIEELWRRTKEQAGISKKFFNEYFKEYEKGFAIKIDSYVKYNEYISLDEAYGKAAPQSFIYID